MPNYNKNAYQTKPFFGVTCTAIFLTILKKSIKIFTLATLIGYKLQ